MNAEIFVFPTSEAGHHNLPAAYEAFRRWGAIWGQPFGLAGHSFAIPIRDWRSFPLHHDIIQFYLDRFFDFARHDTRQFIVSEFWPEELPVEVILPMFKEAPGNVVLPLKWRGGK